MTPAPMIAITVVLTACLVAIIITMAFSLIDYFEKKACHHFCFRCKYRDRCDYYQNKNNPQ